MTNPKKPGPSTPTPKIITNILGPGAKTIVPITKYTPPKTFVNLYSPEQIAKSLTDYQDATTKYHTAKTAYDNAFKGTWILSGLYGNGNIKTISKSGHNFTVVASVAFGAIFNYSAGDIVYIWGTNSSYDGRYAVASGGFTGSSPYITAPLYKSSADSSSVSSHTYGGYIGFGGNGDGWYADTYTKWVAYKAAEKTMQDKKSIWQSKVEQKPIKTTSGNGSGSGSSSGGTLDFQDPTTPVTYNVPAVKAAYFRDDSYYSSNILLGPGGKPIKVTDARQLWGDPYSSSKGMIQVWKYNTFMSATDAANIGTSAWNSSLDNNKMFSTKQKYGFQFMYNPATVIQEWSGLPNINVSYVMSGKDATPFVAPIDTSSSLSFSIPINRVNDMSLLDDKGVYEVATNSNVYYGQKVETSELLTIQNRGTMYDVEYLLKTLVGFEVYSELRGYKTADIGWLLGYAIELHLGNDLRYIGTISYIRVNHTIFNSRMVPIYSTLDLSVTRRVEPVIAGDTSGTRALPSTSNIASAE